MNHGPFALLSFRNFADIQQLGFETGWFILESEKGNLLSEVKFFFGVDEINGALEARFYKLGLNSTKSLKRFLNGF
ncbi:MAG: hypothetical protein ACREOI_01840 [bacterium]